MIPVVETERLCERASGQRLAEAGEVLHEDVATGQVLGRTDSVYESTVELAVQPGVLADGEHQLRARVGF